MPGKNVPRAESQGLGSLKSIREILDLMNEQGISEFELENNGFRVRIKRAGADPSQAVAQPHFAIVHPVQPHASRAASAGAAREEPQPEVQAGADEGLHVIKSPIVGTFYASPGPDKPAFIKTGDKVQAGQVLCIIEAMKLMNEIESDAEGEIASIFVEDGQPVEYGQALFGLVV
ncbi:MAG: acetyl-CoA carboxylase biotin carboxyl carrier protein [Terriglobia bacterium]